MRKQVHQLVLSVSVIFFFHSVTTTNAHCDFELSVSPDGGGNGCVPPITVDVITADGTCRTSEIEKGPGTYIARCTEEGILFLAAGCAFQNCSGTNAEGFDLQSCDSVIDSPGNLYQGVGTAIPTTGECFTLSRVSPPEAFHFHFVGDCAACLAAGGTNSPSSRPSMMPSFPPTLTPSSIPTSTPRPTTTVQPTAAPTKTSMPSEQPTVAISNPPVVGGGVVEEEIIPVVEPGSPTMAPTITMNPAVADSASTTRDSAVASSSSSTTITAKMFVTTTVVTSTILLLCFGSSFIIL